MNILQHNIERFGMVTVMDVVFYDVGGNSPIMFLDTLKMTNISTEGQNKEIRGGIGNDMLISYDFGRTASLEMQDALLSAQSLALLWGTAVSVATLIDRNIIANLEAELAGYTPIAGSVNVYPTDGSAATLGADDFAAVTKESRVIFQEVGASSTTPAQTVNFTVLASNNVDQSITLPDFYSVQTVKDDLNADIAYVLDAERGIVHVDAVALNGASDGTAVITYTTITGSYSQVTLTNDNFPQAMRMVGETFVINEADGAKKRIQIEIPKLKINSNFSFSMDAEGDASVFDFSGVALSDGGDVIKLKYLGNY